MNEKKICKVCGGEYGIDFFPKHPKSKDGHTCVCKDCMRKLQSEGHKKSYENKRQSLEDEVQNARMLRLHDFTPRELMARLAELGYDGKLVYVERHELNLKDFR